jgi:hypothetical protein
MVTFVAMCTKQRSPRKRIGRLPALRRGSVRTGRSIASARLVRLIYNQDANGKDLE